MRPVSLIATYRVTTPMFSAGANQQHAELRPASLKGALRFWFRALVWPELRTVGEVRTAEDELFGSTRTGQAKILLSISNVQGEKLLREQSLDLGLGYLAGLGLATAARGAGADGWMLTKRPALAPRLQFEVKLLLRSVGEAQEARLRRSLVALGLLGGLGARARRGYGSLTLEQLVRKEEGGSRELWTPPWDPAGLRDAISSVLVDCGVRPHSPPQTEPPYTAFSSRSRIVLLSAGESEGAKSLLSNLGLAMLHFRGYGRDKGGRRCIGDEDALQWFRDDHDEMWRVAASRAKGAVSAPRRAVFGLPHNYYFKSIGTSVDVAPQGKDRQGKERRASPLLMHVHHPSNAPPIAVVSFFPAVFLPDSTLQLTRRKEGELSHHVPATLPESPVLWQPIHDFLDELLKGDRSALCAKFPGAVEVTP